MWHHRTIPKFREFPKNTGTGTKKTLQVLFSFIEEIVSEEFNMDNIYRDHPDYQNKETNNFIASNGDKPELLEEWCKKFYFKKKLEDAIIPLAGIDDLTHLYEWVVSPYAERDYYNHAIYNSWLPKYKELHIFIENVDNYNDWFWQGKVISAYNNISNKIIVYMYDKLDVVG